MGMWDGDKADGRKGGSVIGKSLKIRREAKAMHDKATNDPAIREVWIGISQMVFVMWQKEGVGPEAHSPSTWVASFTEMGPLADKPPTRQELEYWKAVCDLRMRTPLFPPDWLAPIQAMIAAADILLEDAVVGPSSERY